MSDEQSRFEREAELPHARGRDRRRGIHDILATLAALVAQRRDPPILRGALEEGIRRAVAVRAVTLRETTSRWGRASERAGVESIALDVAGWSPRTSGVLEATFDPGCRLGEWDFQQLKAASHLATLILELERGRVPVARNEPAAVQPQLPSRDGAAPLIGSTPAMTALRTRIERLARTDFTVLLEGESGVGKELVARQIHELSVRRTGPFVAINCAALVETLLEAELFGIEDKTATGVRGRRGKFEHADGGTLFLDEVSDLSLTAQAKLLRAIQDLAIERVGATGPRRVDIRIVAATNRGLAEMVERKLFRADLFYRLGGIDLRVPPLRERTPDILELARYFLERHRERRALCLSDAASRALTSYHWPGNVRELERMIERAVAMAEGDVIELDDLPAAVRGDYERVLMPSFRRRESLRLWAARYARLVLERCEGNKRRTARELGISYHTLMAYLQNLETLERAALEPSPEQAIACESAGGAEEPAVFAVAPEPGRGLALVSGTSV